MINKGCASSGASPYYNAYNKYFNSSWAITDLHTGLPICLQSHRGWAGTQPAGFVVFRESAEALARLIGKVTLASRVWDGVYLDDGTTMYNPKFLSLILATTDYFDINGDGQADDVASIYAQYAAYRPYFFAKIREAIGPDRHMITNTGPPFTPDPVLNGISIESESCHSLDPHRVPASAAACAEAFLGQHLASVYEPKVSLYWLTEEQLVNASMQCRDVEEISARLTAQNGTLWQGVDLGDHTWHHPAGCNATQTEVVVDN